LAVALFLAGTSLSWPHDLFSAYVQHRVGLVIRGTHMDVTVVLTFFEDSSEHEREHMDTNGDGRLSRAELDAYVRTLEPAWSRAMSLRVGEHRLSLIPLREPEVDLLGNDRVGRGHHRLTLRFFIPTPPELEAGAELVIENKLWPDARALGALHVEGRGGFELQSLAPADPVHPPVRGNEAREFKVRVVAVPLRGGETASEQLPPTQHNTTQ
jgi:hypothetical protein